MKHFFEETNFGALCLVPISLTILAGVTLVAYLYVCALAGVTEALAKAL